MLKKTKIIATISDLNCDVDFLKKLYTKGVNIMRLNTAHQSPKDTLKVVKNIRKVSDKIAILIDTKGPEVRITDLDKTIELKKGDKIFLKGSKSDKSSRDCVYVNYPKFVSDVPKNSRIFIDDGKLSLKVISKTSTKLVCLVENNGSIKKKKSVNVPSVHLNLPTLTKKDKEFIKFSVENDIDFIAHSFVRTKQDVIAVRKLARKYGKDIKVISKIENQEGVDNLSEILEETYGVMVARGDLAIEIPAEKVPIIQKKIINECITMRHPVIVATQMLQSMIENPRPTRAEISDVANAIYSGTDAIMLSEETAMGKHPIEAVEVMVKVALEVEKEMPGFNDLPVKMINNEISAYLAKSAVIATQRLPIVAILTDAMTGRTARYISAFRANVPIFVECYEKNTMRELALSYGVQPSYVHKSKKIGDYIGFTVRDLLKKRLLKQEDLISIIAGSYDSRSQPTFMEISEAKKLI